MDLNLNSETVERIADQLGTTADKIFPLLSDHAYALGVAEVVAIGTLVLALVMYIAITVFTYPRSSMPDKDVLAVVMWVAGILFAFILGAAITSALPNIMCPDGAAAYRCIELLAQ